MKFSKYRAPICNPFKEPRNRFPAWRAGTITTFDAPALQATLTGGIDSKESIPGLLKCLQIRIQLLCSPISPFLMTTFTVVFSISPCLMSSTVALMKVFCSSSSCAAFSSSAYGYFCNPIFGVFSHEKGWVKGQFSQTTGKIARQGY
jgi:hypothetical protein